MSSRQGDALFHVTESMATTEPKGGPTAQGRASFASSQRETQAEHSVRTSMRGTLTYTAWVMRATDFVVHSGANAGDPLPDPETSVTGDLYRLDRKARPARLVLSLEVPAQGQIADGSEIGKPGQRLMAAGRLTFMAPDGDCIEVLVLVLSEAEGQGFARARFALPLAPLRAGVSYSLIAVEKGVVGLRLANALAGAFASGTRILTADGKLVPVETLRPGDLILTREHGAQPLRWRGSVRLKADGPFAPVVINPGVMGNPRPLVVSPHHRLFLYAREARALAGAADLMVQARHLVDGERILRRPGGFIVYHGLVFDAHEVIYAEGVPCESLQVCPETLTRLPAELADAVIEAFPGLAQRLHPGTEIDAALVSRLELFGR